jgi:hypothetical protein
MEEELIKYKIDTLFENEIVKDRKSFENRFFERYKVLNSNILLTEKIKSLAKQKNSSENIIIWNIYGFLNMLQYDLTSVGYNLVFENKPWQKVYYARQVILIMYEAFKDLPEILGKYYKQLFNGIDEAKPYLETLNGYKKEFESLNEMNKDFLQHTRMNVSAHRDQDIDKQLQVIRDIDPYRVIRIMFDFEKILRNIAEHIESYLVHSIKLEK